MNREIIHSTSNARVKRVRKLLQSAAERKQSGRFVVEGVRAVRTLAFNPRSGYRIDASGLSGSHCAECGAESSIHWFAGG